MCIQILVIGIFKYTYLFLPDLKVQNQLKDLL